MPANFHIGFEFPKPQIIQAILINSISGIFGQLSKENILNEVLSYWPLFFAVIIGGFLGNYLKGLN